MLTAYVTGSGRDLPRLNLLAQLPVLIGESIDFAESLFISGSGSGNLRVSSPPCPHRRFAGDRHHPWSFTSASIVTRSSHWSTLLGAPRLRGWTPPTWVDKTRRSYRTIEQIRWSVGRRMPSRLSQDDEVQRPRTVRCENCRSGAATQVQAT